MPGDCAAEPPRPRAPLNLVYIETTPQRGDEEDSGGFSDVSGTAGGTGKTVFLDLHVCRDVGYRGDAAAVEPAADPDEATVAGDVRAAGV